MHLGIRNLRSTEWKSLDIIYELSDFPFKVCKSKAMIFSVTSPGGEKFQTLSCKDCDKLELFLFTLLFDYYCLICLHNLHWGYAILVQGKPGHCLMVMHSWSRAPQYFDCSPEIPTEPETTGSWWLWEAGWSKCAIAHSTTPLAPVGFLTPRSEPRRLLTVDLRLSATPGFIFHIEWQCLSAEEKKSKAVNNGGRFNTSRLFQRTSQLCLAPAAARRTLKQGPQV